MSRKPAKTQHGSTTKPKRRKEPTDARRRASAVVGKETKVARLGRDRITALADSIQARATALAASVVANTPASSTNVP